MRIVIFTALFVFVRGVFSSLRRILFFPIILISSITHLAEYERNYFDEWSWHLIMLRLFLFRVLLITQFDRLKGQRGRAQKKILVLLITSLVLRFSVNRILQFYLFFENLSLFL